MLAQLAAFWGLVKETESHILVRLLRLLLCFDLGWGCGGGSGGRDLAEREEAESSPGKSEGAGGPAAELLPVPVSAQLGVPR